MRVEGKLKVDKCVLTFRLCIVATAVDGWKHNFIRFNKYYVEDKVWCIIFLVKMPLHREFFYWCEFNLLLNIQKISIPEKLYLRSLQGTNGSCHHTTLTASLLHCFWATEVRRTAQHQVLWSESDCGGCYLQSPELRESWARSAAISALQARVSDPTSRFSVQWRPQQHYCELCVCIIAALNLLKDRNVMAILSVQSLPLAINIMT